MTSHIFVALGMWDDVVRANEKAVTVQAEAARRAGREPAHCGHYNAWLDYGYLQLGRLTDARALLEACKQQATISNAEHAGHNTDPDAGTLSSFIAMWSRYVIDTEDWSGDVALWPIDAGMAPAPRLTLAFIRGLGAARRGDAVGLHEARTAYARARTDMQAELAKDATDPGAAEFTKRLDVLDLELQALSASIGGQGDQAIELLRRAAAAEEEMAYAFGPPFVDKPVHELLGEEQLRQRRPDEARAAFRASIERNPGRVTALRGLQRAESMLAAAGQTRRDFHTPHP